MTEMAMACKKPVPRCPKILLQKVQGRTHVELANTDSPDKNVRQT